MKSNIAIGNVISFDVYPSAILGSGFHAMKVKAIIDAETAIALGTDVVALHHSIFPLLPEGSAPNNSAGYNYLKLESQDGRMVIVGEPWIKLDTVTIVELQQAVVIVKISSNSDLEVIRRAMAANNLSVVSVDIVK